MMVFDFLRKTLGTPSAQGTTASGSKASPTKPSSKAPQKTSLGSKLGFPVKRALQVSKTFSVPLEDYAQTGERDAILASSGMGKSYLTGVLMEETLENGSLLCVIDPEGEHFTLAERYPMLIVGGEQSNVPFDPDALEVYIEAMLGSGISGIFDLSEFVDVEQQGYYAMIADALFTAEQRYRRKIRLVVEEAQIYAPQSGSTATTVKGKGIGGSKLDPLVASQRIAKRGRKRALDSLWATQRPASISKDILSQCNRFWFGGITSELDYKAIRPFLTEAGISFNDVKALQPGEFYCYSKGKTTKIKVRKRYCKHAGATPEAGVLFQAASDKTLDTTLNKLIEQINRKAYEKQKEVNEAERYKSVIRQLEDEIVKLQKELEEERMATRVIERLGALPTGSLTDRKKERKTQQEVRSRDAKLALGEGASGLPPVESLFDASVSQAHVASSLPAGFGGEVFDTSASHNQGYLIEDAPRSEMTPITRTRTLRHSQPSQGGHGTSPPSHYDDPAWIRSKIEELSRS
ncbi:MAG: helicase HerA domain-containing protein [Vampirovibrionales bacterium]